MILWIYDDIHAYQYPLKNMSEEITVDDFHFSLMRVRRGYLLSSSFHQIRMYLQVSEITDIVCEGHVYHCHLLQMRQDYRIYKRFTFTNTITIGTDEKNDICISDDLICKFHLSCNPKTKEIQIFSSRPVTTLNARIIKDKCQFHNGDILAFMTYRIILFPNGIMINNCMYMNVKIESYGSTILKAKKITNPSLKIRYYAPSPSIQQEYSLSIRNFHIQNDETGERPFILSIGPVFLMSVASLSSGVLSAYQSYMDGREPASYLPMILLPGIMFFSTVFFQPLVHYYEKKRSRKKYVVQLKRYESYLNSVQNDFETFKNSYKKQSAEYFEQTDRIVEHIYRSNTQRKRNCDVSILAGYKKNVLDIHIQKENFEDPKVNKMIEERLECIRKDEMFSWIVHFNAYKHIAIVSGSRQMLYFEQLLLQIMFYYDIPVCFYIDHEDVEKNQWIRQIPNVYFQQMRMIFQKWDDVVECIRRSKGEMVLIDFYRTLPSDVDCMVIQLLRADSYVACDLMIDPSNGTFVDYRMHREEAFSWDDQYHFDPGKVCYYLRDPKADIVKYNNDFFSVHQIEDLNDIDIRENWKMHCSSESLLAYIGIDQNGKRIVLDLNEKKDGPHGLIAGMTGSGKSEMIISLLLSLAFRYSYTDVQFALIDFKGGGGSEVLMDLPHICGKLTNLDTSNMNRALISFHNECIYRQVCIQKMNQSCGANVMNISDYRCHWKEEYGLPQLAELLIVIDEFAELKHQHPQFMDDLISVSRIGRSLGIHLILCTQKPTGVINDEILSNCSFRICLKVQDRQDSKQMIHCEDAVYLKQPGSFYLLSDNGLQKGMASYANTSRSISNTKVDILDEKGDTICSSDDLPEKEETEISRTIDRILEVSKDHTKKGLWLEPLSPSDCEMMQDDIFALIDDYYERRYIPLHAFDEKKRNTIFVCNEYEEIQHCMNTILYACMNTLKGNEEIYLICNEKNTTYEKLKENYRNLIDIVSENDVEKEENMMRHIRNDSNETKILIITDPSILMHSDRNDMHELLEHANMYNLFIFLFIANGSAIKYKDLSFVQRRFVLTDEDLQDIQQILQTSEKVIQKKSLFGLCKMKHVLEFCICRTPFSSLFTKAGSIARINGYEKPYRIPFMQEVISRSDYHGLHIPIGISYDTYEWISCNPCESIYVVSMYKEEWIRYFHVMKPYCKCTTLLDEDFDDGQMIFLSLDEYRIKHDPSRGVLYIGTSFQRQYTFYSRNTITTERDAIYFRNLESMKMRVL